jgi:hypothetical protein
MRLIALKPLALPYSEEHYHPVRALWARVIVRAICDYVVLKSARDIRSKRDFRALQKFLFEEQSGLHNICSVIDLSVEKVRHRALTMTIDEVRKIEHRDRDKPSLLMGNSTDDDGEDQ